MRLSKGLENLLDEWPIQKLTHVPEPKKELPGELSIVRSPCEIKVDGESKEGRVKVSYLRQKKGKATG